jgi:DNA polymerase I-like protein with 3'-5' exonuclease and polymerase domains
MIQRKHQMPVELLMVVHDEFVVQCPKQNATEVAVWLENIMKEAMQPLLDPVQCEVESSWGNSWGKNK